MITWSDYIYLSKKLTLGFLSAEPKKAILKHLCNGKYVIVKLVKKTTTTKQLKHEKYISNPIQLYTNYPHLNSLYFCEV